MKVKNLHCIIYITNRTPPQKKPPPNYLRCYSICKTLTNCSIQPLPNDKIYNCTELRPLNFK